VDKEYKILRQEIQSKAEGFPNHLQEVALTAEAYELLQCIVAQTRAFIFSGVIRNYLLGENNKSRDLDIVVENLDIVVFPSEYRNVSSRNSFGGYKIGVNGMYVDIWDINNTWSILQNSSIKPTPNSLAKTAFFNFSAIDYDWNSKTFIYDDSFLDFYDLRVMDVVNEANPKPELCIVNSMYYALKCGFPMKYRLCKWIVEHYDGNLDYTIIQTSHFGQVYFSNETIKGLYESCNEVLPEMRKKRDGAFFRLEM